MIKTFSFFATLLVVSVFNLNGQCTYSSSQGSSYSVTISLKPLDIVVEPSPLNCSGGVYYTIKMEYTVGVQGNIPGGSLNELNGMLFIDGDVLRFDLPKQSGSGVLYATLVNNCNSRTTIPVPPVNATISIQGPGISNQINQPCNLLDSSLPVELTSFDVTTDKNNIQIGWSTASERNNDYFVVERSADGKYFEELGRITGAGTTSTHQNYKLEDTNPNIGLSYYRLRQVDFDGTETTKGIRSVQFFSADLISLFPNPATEGRVCLKGDYINTSVVILSSTGKVISQFNNYDNCIDISAFEKGIYFFNFSSEETLNSQTIRVVVQ